MDILELLVGKKVDVKTDMKVVVELEIKKVTHNVDIIQITPDTPENDWWGETKNRHSYTVEFTNGAKKTYDNIEQIKIK